jgi:hypothetical protein
VGGVCFDALVYPTDTVQNIVYKRVQMKSFRIGFWLTSAYVLVGFPASVLAYDAQFQTTSLGDFSIRVCENPSPFCVGRGSEVEVQLRGPGGNGGASVAQITCDPSLGYQCSHGGGGGQGGGFVRFKFTVPSDIALPATIQGKHYATGSLPNVSVSDPRYHGRISISLGYGERFVTLGTAYAGANGLGSTLVAGGLGGNSLVNGQIVTEGPGRWSLANQLQTVLLNSSVGGSGGNGGLRSKCTGGTAGVGGAAGNVYQLTTPGSGGAGAIGKSCKDGVKRQEPGMGVPGSAIVKWFSPVGPGVSGSKTFSSVGEWSQQICAEATTTCPGSGRLVTVEVISGGGGGQGGVTAQAPGVFGNRLGGAGGVGGESGKYASVSFYLPVNSTQVKYFRGKVGSGGTPGPIDYGVPNYNQDNRDYDSTAYFNGTPANPGGYSMVGVSENSTIDYDALLLVPGGRGGFARFYAAPDFPVSFDEIRVKKSVHDLITSIASAAPKYYKFSKPRVSYAWIGVVDSIFDDGEVRMNDYVRVEHQMDWSNLSNDGTSAFGPWGSMYNPPSGCEVPDGWNSWYGMLNLFDCNGVCGIYGGSAFSTLNGTPGGKGGKGGHGGYFQYALCNAQDWNGGLTPGSQGDAGVVVISW